MNHDPKIYYKNEIDTYYNLKNKNKIKICMAINFGSWKITNDFYLILLILFCLSIK